MSIFNKKNFLVISSVFLITNILSAQDKSPFEKYDPNEQMKVSTQNGNSFNSSGLSQEQEMQVRDLIFQELSLKEQAMDLKKEAGLIDYDDSETLYLGQNEELKGVARNQYIIFNSSTNLFKYLDTNKYKKVVTYEERMAQQNSMEGENAVN